MTTPAGCLLCRIVRGELRSDTIVETEHVIGFMNTTEAKSRGHCVFFPKRHAPSLHEADDDALAEILVLVKRVAVALGIETYNVLQNNGALAGQTVFHAHLHLIPKWSESEGLRYERGGQRINQTEMSAKIKANLARGV